MDSQVSIHFAHRAGTSWFELLLSIGCLVRPSGDLQRTSKNVWQLCGSQLYSKSYRSLWELHNPRYITRKCSRPSAIPRQYVHYNRRWNFTDDIIENFDSLGDLVASYPLITRTTHFVLVPGPLDVTINVILPRKPLLSSLVNRLKSKIPRLHLATNPCRIKFFSQEIVIFREDMMAMMLRNLVGVKPDVRNDDLKRYVRSVCCWSPSPYWL